MTKSSLRNYQDRMANQGWRIPLIPFNDSSKPIMIQTNWFAVLGAIVFVGGLGLSFHKDDIRYVYAALGGLAFALAGIWFVAKFRRRNWVKVEARCMDKDVQTGFNGEGAFWAFRLLCTFAYQGKNYSVTPIFWRGFTSKNSINDFLGKKIQQDGRCFLYVNPKNPLQTELAAGDLADKLIH